MDNFDEKFFESFKEMLKKTDFIEKGIKNAREIKNIEVIGEAGGGFVKVKMNGDFQIKEIIYEENDLIKNDLKMFVDLIICAQNDAIRKLHRKFNSEMLPNLL